MNTAMLLAPSTVLAWSAQGDDSDAAAHGRTVAGSPLASPKQVSITPPAAGEDNVRREVVKEISSDHRTTMLHRRGDREAIAAARRDSESNRSGDPLARLLMVAAEALVAPVE